MASYSFETIGTGQALAFTAGLDTLSFTASGSSAGTIQVTFPSLISGFSNGHFFVTSGVTGRSVEFGSDFGGVSNVTFPDGTVAIIGRGSLAGTLSGGAESDAIFSGSPGNFLDAGGGADTLVSGGGSDALQGGSGADVFEFLPIDPLFPSTGMPGRDEIYDFEASDRLSFGSLAVTAANYTTLAAMSSDTAAYDAANALIGAGTADVVAVPWAQGVLLFVDTRQDNGKADEIVYISGGRTLADIHLEQFVNLSPPRVVTSAPEPTLPAAPADHTSGGGTIDGNMDATHIGVLVGAAITSATSTFLGIQGTSSLSLTGTGFTYDLNQQLTGGTITHIVFGGASLFADVTLPGGVAAAPFLGWVVTDDSATAFTTLLAGANNLAGSTRADVIHAYGGDDIIHGRGGGDQIYGGDGDDQIYGGEFPLTQGGGNLTASTYLRGEAGNDYMVGADGFDDMNGNMGNDTLSGGLGDDWVVGGKDDDLLFGDAGGDVVWGNLGNDTCLGGDGADQIRGGQGDDVIYGGAGDDWLSGDRGSDTITGGAGADIFHTFGDAGIDRVLDFNVAEGDRVLLDPGTQYSLAQVGADVVISMVGGAQMTLVGVTLATLPPGWIFGA